MAVLRRFVLLLAFMSFALWSGVLCEDKVAHGQRGAAASVHPLASQAGLDVLKSSGNAVDAAVAIGLMLGVVR